VGLFRKGDWGLKILSLFLGVVFWVYVSNELNPTKEREFKAISVEARGVGHNLAVSELPGNASVRVQANQNVIAELDTRSIEVYTDLSDAQPGENIVPVRVKVPAGVKVTDLRPQQVTVVLEPLAEKQIPVRLKYTGEPEKGHRLLTARTKPDDIIVRGPESIVNRVDFASIEIGLKGRIKSFSETVPVKVGDDQGNFLEEMLVKRTPAIIDVFITIVPEMPSKKVNLIPLITGEPARGYVVEMTVVEPQEITVTGDETVLNGMAQVFTYPVDITGTDKDVFVDTGPDLPAGVMADRQSVKILVKIGREQ